MLIAMAAEYVLVGVRWSRETLRERERGREGERGNSVGDYQLRGSCMAINGQIVWVFLHWKWYLFRGFFSEIIPVKPPLAHTANLDQ